MDLQLRDYFDVGTLQRGQDYAHRGLVATVEPLPDGSIRGRVLNGRGKSYQQRISLESGFVDGICSCPVGHNCKHVVAVLMTWAERDNSSPQLAAPVRGWLTRVKQQPTALEPLETRPKDYPDNVKERLFFILIPNEPSVRVDIYKGRINAAGTGLNKAIRRYDALHALRSNAVAKFIRPTDLELLSALAQTRLWQTASSSCGASQ